jgi:hypothetical protein
MLSVLVGVTLCSHKRSLGITKERSISSIGSRPCKKRKDGAPTVPEQEEKIDQKAWASRPLLGESCRMERPVITPEVILAATSGDRPFSDSIIAVSTDGAWEKTFFSPSWVRSYTGIAALSLARPMVIRQREANGTSVLDSLLDYDPITGKITPSCRDVKVKKGMGTLSADGLIYAFPNFPSSRAGITFVQCDQMRSQFVSCFQDMEIQNARSWYISLDWNGSDRELLAVKVWRGKAAKGLLTELHLINTVDKSHQVPLGQEEGVVAAAAGPNGQIAVFTKNGIEVLTSGSGQRRLLLPIVNLNNRKYSGGGMVWLKRSGILALSLLASNETAGELWVIPIGDGSARVITRKQGFRFSSICVASSQN